MIKKQFKQWKNKREWDKKLKQSTWKKKLDTINPTDPGAQLLILVDNALQKIYILKQVLKRSATRAFNLTKKIFVVVIFVLALVGLAVLLIYFRTPNVYIHTHILICNKRFAIFYNPPSTVSPMKIIKLYILRSIGSF